jgi:hypothetical protein
MLEVNIHERLACGSTKQTGNNRLGRIGSIVATRTLSALGTVDVAVASFQGLLLIHLGLHGVERREEW